MLEEAKDMRKATYLWRALVLAALVVMAVSAFAEVDPTVPLWRGSEGSTYQKWSFDSEDNPAVLSSDPGLNPYGDPTAFVTVGDLGSGWQPNMGGFGTQTGLWDLGSLGTISIDLPNRPYDGGFKELWISVVCFEDPGWMVAPAVEVLCGGVISFLGEETYLVEEDSISGQWNVRLTKWRIEPNPNSEHVLITSDVFGSVIDRIEIDTICVPEPASFATLLMGGPFLLALRRRKA